MFIDVPTQYPELREFAKTFDNVDIVYPKLSYIQIVDKYGFPLINKEISRKFYELEVAMRNGKEDCYVLHQLNGDYVSKNGKTNLIKMDRWKFMKDAPFSVSHMCCFELKKYPAMRYQRKTKRYPILAQMADESMLRTQAWLKDGCNGFDMKHPKSNPMAFWTEQDVLQYIKQNNLPICSVYGDIVYDLEAEGQMKDQLSLFDLEEYKDLDSRPLTTSKCKRTGCVLCGFGCHLEKSPNRFEMLRESHPGMYSLIDVVKNNGYTMRQAIDWMNEHGDTNIKY